MRYGYFDNGSREYVIDRVDVPVSWTNYLGVKDLCTIISQNAGGYSFYKSAEHGRITRFRANGVPLDRPGQYVYFATTKPVSTGQSPGSQLARASQRPGTNAATASPIPSFSAITRT